MHIDNDLCFECGDATQEWHHVIPKSMGGTKMIPLCSCCHSKIHGLGDRRDQISELTKRGMNKKMSQQYHAIWWFHFKCANTEEGMTIDEMSKEFELSTDSIKRCIKRLKEMDSGFLKEIVLPHQGTDYEGTSIFNLEPFDLSEEDAKILFFNRKTTGETSIE